MTPSDAIMNLIQELSEDIVSAIDDSAPKLDTLVPDDMMHTVMTALTFVTAEALASHYVLSGQCTPQDKDKRAQRISFAITDAILNELKESRAHVN